MGAIHWGATSNLYFTGGWKCENLGENIGKNIGGNPGEKHSEFKAINITILGYGVAVTSAWGWGQQVCPRSNEYSW